ncbi:MAG: hypothetical protein AUI21_03535 [Nitrospirae bacterium 13_1_40CM_2_62_10]|nr:MAG: hypothetical protein AUI21_03535 [Nitrospirae bacterium 13_1_40CM_2_62_10]
MAIDHLDVEGFRGVNRPMSIDFGRGATIFTGLNGKGKTSILRAVEWCLFGELRYQERENASHDEIVNMQHPEGRARASITLSRTGERYVVSRERKVAKRGSALNVALPGGRSLVDEEAKAFLFHLTGLTFEDFYRAVFLHQESVRGLLLEEPRFRDEALDRLFGLEKLRDVLASIPMRFLASAVDEIESTRERLTERLTGAASELERHRTKCLEEAIELGFSESELTLETGKNISREVRAEVLRVDGDMSIDVARLPEITAVDDLEKFARRAKELIRHARLARGQLVPVGETTDRLVRIARLRGELDEARRQLQESEAAMATLEQKVGGLTDLERSASNLRKDVADWDEALRAMDVHARVVSDALLYFKAESEASLCPVCRQSISAPSLVHRLEKEIQGTQRKQIERLTQQVEQGKVKLRDLDESRIQMERLQRKAEEASQSIEEVLVRVRELVGRQPKEPTSALEGLKKEEKEIVAQLDRLKDAQKHIEEALQQVDVTVDRVRSLSKFLKAEEEFARLRKRAPSGEAASEADSLQAETEDLIDLREALESIVQAINAVAAERAQNAIQETRAQMSEFYRTLCNHPYFDDLRIEISQKLASGVQKNSYSIRAISSQEGRSSLASSRLSTAQMNCVALSVYLAQSNVLAHSLGFIILDDPSQNLDAEHKLALASILGRFATEQQIIVATHDEEFDVAMRNAFRGEGVVHYTLEWSSRTGARLAGS